MAAVSDWQGPAPTGGLAPCAGCVFWRGGVLNSPAIACHLGLAQWQPGPCSHWLHYREATLMEVAAAAQALRPEALVELGFVSRGRNP